MAFELLGLLGEEAPELTLDSLAADFARFFSTTENFHIEQEQDPFNPSERNLHLTWNDWWTRVFLESGPDVLADSATMSESAPQDRRAQIGRANRRIRVLFADDQSQDYTNHIIFMMDFLGEIPSIAIFDPQQQVFV
jgi:hypothetical protein